MKNKQISVIYRKTLFALLVMLSFAVSAAAQTYYEIRDIGVLPDKTSSTATEININGDVVGRSDNRAFVYRECKIYDLGTLGGNDASAEAISKSGTIFGWAQRANGVKRGFSFSNGVMFDLGGDKTLEEAAVAVSSWELPAGVETVPGFGKQSVWYFNGNTHILPFFFGSGGPTVVRNVTDVNNSLQVTGSDDFNVGVVTDPGFGQWVKIEGIPGFGPVVTPFAINESSHVVGAAGFPFPHAFFSKDPKLPALDLGTLGGPSALSAALDINNQGLIVGWSESSQRSGPIAFLHDGNTMIDLRTRLVNPTGWTLTEAVAINDKGLIAGNGFFNGLPRAFVLVPSIGRGVKACIPPILGQ